jgi:hypothetical protein
LAQIQGLGPPGLGRLMLGRERAAGAALAASGEKPTLPREPERADRAVRPPLAGKGAEGGGRGKRGPPPGPRPWLALGISRATYWRRKKGGK